MNILTIGDFASLNEQQIESLPIRLPGKVERAKRELTQMYSHILFSEEVSLLNFDRYF